MLFLKRIIYKKSSEYRFDKYNFLFNFKIKEI